MRRRYFFWFLIFSLILVQGSWSQLPPKKLVVHKNLSGQSELFWFFPDAERKELFYDDGVPQIGFYVTSAWLNNRAGVRFTPQHFPYFVDSIRIFISHDNPPSPGDSASPFQVALYSDSGGLPGSPITDLVLTSADSTAWQGNGQWLPVAFGYCPPESVSFWGVFHWFQATPAAPKIGADDHHDIFVSATWPSGTSQQEWDIFSQFNFMFRAVTFSNGPTTADSFSVHRAADSGFVPTNTSRIATLSAPIDHFVGQPAGPESVWYYRVTAWENDQESPGSNAVRIVQSPTAVEGESDFPIPQQVTLLPNYPNPFNARTVIRYALDKEAFVSLDIFDLLGRRVKTLFTASQKAGLHQVAWEGTDDRGRTVPSGIYFVRLTAGAQVQRGRMLLLK